MDRKFQRALALVLKSEGGRSDNSADPGGATMKSVTLANFRRYMTRTVSAVPATPFARVDLRDDVRSL